MALQPEPENFDRDVRQKGLAWLAEHDIEPAAPPPKAGKLPAYWQATNRQLWEAYDGVCAYLAIYFEWATGASSTDHFVAKSRHAGGAYEWSNYRLSCLGANRSKHAFDDVLDPIGLPENTFHLNLASGHIYPAPHLPDNLKRQAMATIERLELDSPDLNAMRARHFARYLRGKDIDTLRELSPFVWHEARRQNLL
ncbi:MAG: hypothetical protein ACQEUN_11690 [Pseudomonadota bacterium]